MINYKENFFSIFLFNINSSTLRRGVKIRSVQERKSVSSAKAGIRFHQHLVFEENIPKERISLSQKYLRFSKFQGTQYHRALLPEETRVQTGTSRSIPLK